MPQRPRARRSLIEQIEFNAQTYYQARLLDPAKTEIR
jgi:hypothetical protein